MRVAIADYLLRCPPLDALAMAARVGFAGLELSYGPMPDPEHPLDHPEGPARLRQAAAEAGVELVSLSATFAVWRDWRDEGDRAHLVATLDRLLPALVAAGIPRVHLPWSCPATAEVRFVRRALGDTLARAADRAGALGVTLAVELPCPAAEARDFLAGLARPGIVAAYEVGQALADGRDVVTELRLWGTDLGLVRLKDRQRREPFASVPLGEGQGDWPTIVAAIARLQPPVWSVLGTPAGNAPEAAAHRNLEFLRRCLPAPVEPRATAT